ncbi:MAG: TIGR03668 family PPOX class F420-dependent oxidoreductase [Mycobacterium sp.]
MAGPDSAARFARAPLARLATVTPDGLPHLVPIVFALVGDTIYTAVDGKPKSTRRLRRLANIEAHPHVSVLVDHYDDDWSLLWWVRADGQAEIHGDGPGLTAGHSALRAKYRQYETVTLEGPVIAVTVSRWATWSS